MGGAFCRGAPKRNRTVDLLLTMETLCRLSYRGPVAFRGFPRGNGIDHTPNRTTVLPKRFASRRPSEGRLQQPAERIARGHDPLHVPLRQRRRPRAAPASRRRPARSPGRRDVPPEPGHPVHRRLHRHPALDSLGPHGPGEGIPVGPPVPRHPHDVLLVGVPVTAVGRPHAPATARRDRRPAPCAAPPRRTAPRTPPAPAPDSPCRCPTSRSRRDVGRSARIGVRQRRPPSAESRRPRQPRDPGSRSPDLCRRRPEAPRPGHRLGDLDVPERRHDDLVTDSDTCGAEHCSSTHAADAGRAT